MTERKPNNSILVLATLGVYLGLVLIGGASQIEAQTAQNSEPIINKRPLVAFAIELNDKIKKDAIDLEAPFSVEITGTLDDQGRFESKTFKNARITGNQSSAEMGVQAIRAIEGSGYLQYLSAISVKSTTVRLEQNDSEFKFEVLLVNEAETRAKSSRSALDMMLAVASAILEKKVDADDDDRAMLAVLRSRTVKSEGKTVALAFRLPKSEFHEMIVKSLAKQNRS